MLFLRWGYFCLAEVSLTNPNHYGLKVGSKKQQQQHLDGDSDHGSSNLALIDESSHDKQLIKMDQPQLMMVTKKGWTQLFGAEMPPDIIAIAMVYFVQGILNLPMLAMNYFLKDNLHLDPAEVNNYLPSLILFSLVFDLAYILPASCLISLIK
jgi:hypothetical protein